MVKATGPLARLNVPTPANIPAADYVTEDGTELIFSRYKEDGTLRLFKKDSILSDEPAGYTDDEVTVKVLIRERGRQSFMVVLPVRRGLLIQPSAMSWMVKQALEFRK